MEEPTFKRFLHVRLENGGSLASIGREFGVKAGSCAVVEGRASFSHGADAGPSCDGLGGECRGWST